MTNSMWQQTEEMAKKHDQGGSLWLKLAGDGDKAVVVFLGEPHPREVAFVDGKYVEVDGTKEFQEVQSLGESHIVRQVFQLLRQQ